jgi:uncharacterized membrane protein (DUF2068 family)
VKWHPLTDRSQTAPNHTRPLGISLLALLMFLVGGVWLLAAVALPLLGTPLAPWYILLGASAYFMIVGWGLWGTRRWAYLAALLMCVVLGFYQLRAALLPGQNVLAPLLVLLAIFIYLVRPSVRTAFLAKQANGERSDEP